MKTCENSKSLFQLTISKWGKSLQKIVAIEELSELQKELCKSIRQGTHYESTNKDNVEEEIADVLIMIEQLKQMYNEENINKWIDVKLINLENMLNISR